MRDLGVCVGHWIRLEQPGEVGKEAGEGSQKAPGADRTCVTWGPGDPASVPALPSTTKVTSVKVLGVHRPCGCFL